jgi:hypothetical protein
MYMLKSPRRRALEGQAPVRRRSQFCGSIHRLQANLFQSFQKAFRSLQSSFKRLPNISPSLQKISIDFPESGLINGLKGGWAEKINEGAVDRGSAPAPACSSFLPSSFRFLLSKRRAGAIFTIADGVFGRRAGAVSVRTWRPRSLIAREEGNAASAEHPRAMSPETADPAEKTGRSIRRPARIRPLHRKPEPVSSPSQADGRQPFMP